MKEIPRKTSRRKRRCQEPLLVSVPEFAKISGLSEGYTRMLAKKRILPIRVIGKRNWIIREEALTWLRTPPRRRERAA